MHFNLRSEKESFILVNPLAPFGSSAIGIATAAEPLVDFTGRFWSSCLRHEGQKQGCQKHPAYDPLLNAFGISAVGFCLPIKTCMDVEAAIHSILETSLVFSEKPLGDSIESVALLSSTFIGIEITYANQWIYAVALAAAIKRLTDGPKIVIAPAANAIFDRESMWTAVAGSRSFCQIVDYYLRHKVPSWDALCRQGDFDKSIDAAGLDSVRRVGYAKAEVSVYSGKIGKAIPAVRNGNAAVICYDSLQSGVQPNIAGADPLVIVLSPSSKFTRQAFEIVGQQRNHRKVIAAGFFGGWFKTSREAAQAQALLRALREEMDVVTIGFELNLGINDAATLASRAFGRQVLNTRATERDPGIAGLGEVRGRWYPLERTAYSWSSNVGVALIDRWEDQLLTWNCWKYLSQEEIFLERPIYLSDLF